MSVLFARYATPLAVLLGLGVAAFALAEQMSADRRAAHERAVIARSDELTARAMAPGSALACLDAAAGDTTETACEAAVFGSPQATAAAVAYIGARMALLADGRDMPALAPRLAATRRAIELDRFGIAAQVMSQRDGCSAAQCTGFALVTDSSMLRSNLKARTFDQYVSRHAVHWNAAPAAADKPVASAQPPVQVVPVLPTPAVAASEPRPVSSKYDFPSAASIPPVSIMNAEPALSKEAADARQAVAAQGAALGDRAPPAPPQPERTPVPPRRPQAANEPADIAPVR
ncbi:hypothetical protein [Undibacter mobilis]|nr:hypothetical protein [Undibacter mobilis]